MYEAWKKLVVLNYNTSYLSHKGYVTKDFQSHFDVNQKFRYLLHSQQLGSKETPLTTKVISVTSPSYTFMVNDPLPIGLYKRLIFVCGLLEEIVTTEISWWLAV